jgi:type VI secretion system secreted protein Hcp
MAVDMFLKLDGIKGESGDLKHKGEVDILSFSWGASNTSAFGTGGGGGAGKVSVRDISFVHRIDKATPKLMLSCATGQHIPAATLTVRKAGRTPIEYLKVTLSDCLVSSFQVSGNSSGTPSDAFSLNFAKVEFAYYPQNADGSVGAPVIAIIVNDEGPEE